jgi:hypothetical protein
VSEELPQSDHRERRKVMDKILGAEITIPLEDGSTKTIQVRLRLRDDGSIEFLDLPIEHGRRLGAMFGGRPMTMEIVNDELIITPVQEWGL